MASRLAHRPHTLPNLRRLSSAAGGGDSGGASGGGGGGSDGAARPPFRFSDIKDGLRAAPSSPGRMPDLSSSPFPPDPASFGDGAARPPSPFSDIKDRLRSASAPPRSFPDLPPPPPPPGPSSLEDIRKHLAQFRSGTPAASSPPTISFQHLLKNNLLNNTTSNPPAAPPPHTLYFDYIRDSLRKLPLGPPPAASPFSGFRNVRPPPPSAPAPDPLPGSISDKKDDGPRAPKTEFLHMYSYDELGEKLHRLRPQGATAEFSLAELNDRLVKLLDLEEKEADSRMGGVPFRDLTDSLVSLKHKDAEKKAAHLNKLSMLTNLSGLPTPAFMLKEPQEELFERYNHPDHMSSAEKMKLELKKVRVRDEFKMSESDCGSTRVQDMDEKKENLVRQNEDDKNYLRWTIEMDRTLAGILRDQRSIGNKGSGGWKSTAIHVASSLLTAQYGKEITKEKVKNRINTWKKIYGVLSDILSQSGFHWHEGKNIIIVDDDNVWNDYVESHRDAKSFRYKCILNWDDIVDLCGKDRATGEGAETAMDATKKMDKEVVIDLDHVSATQETEGLDTMEDTLTSPQTKQKKINKSPMGKMQSASQDRQPKRRASGKDALASAVEELAASLKEYMQSTTQVLSGNDVYEEINKVEDLDDEERLKACGWFIENEKQFLLLKAYPMEMKRKFVEMVLGNLC